MTSRANQPPSPKDVEVLDYLVSKLLSWVGGAVDTWSILPMSGLAVDLRGLLLEKCGMLRSILTVTRLAVLDKVLTDRKEIESVLCRMEVGLDNLQDGLLFLVEFMTLSDKELLEAIQALTNGWRQVVQSVRELEALCGIRAAYWSTYTPDREDYFGSILNNMYERFAEARATGMAPRSLQMPAEAFQLIKKALEGGGCAFANPKMGKRKGEGRDEEKGTA